MGLFRKKPIRMRFGKGDFEIPISGVEYRPDVASKVAGKRPSDDSYKTKNVTLQMIREPKNKRDKWAIAVHHEKHGQVGYIPRTVNKKLAKALDKAAKRKSVIWLFTAELEAEWDEAYPLDPPDVSITATLDPKLRARPAK